MTAASPAPPPRLSLPVQIGYGSGALANGIGQYALAGSVLQLYFNQVIGLPAVWVGAAIMATMLIDAVTDPLIGWFSDGLRTPLGRRHALMYASAVPSALGVYFLWQAPQGLSEGALLAFVVAMLLFVRVATSFFEIPNSALAPEIAPDYDDRTKLFAWRFLFLVMGGALINAVLYQVFLREDAANPQGILNRERYEDFGLFAAGVAFFAILICSAATHRRIRHLYVPQASGVTLGRTWRELKATFSNRPLLILIVTNLFISTAAGVTSGLATYMYVHLWGLKPQEISYILAIGPFSAFLPLWGAPKLAQRFGKKPVMLAFYVSWLIVAILPFTLWLLGLAPPAGSLALLVFLTADFFIGVALAVGVHIILNSMLSDASEDIAVKADLRSEGVMFAAYGLLAKWGAGIGAFLAGVLLSIVRFPERAAPGTVDLEIMRNLVLVNLPTITLCNLAAIVCVSFFTIDRARHEANLAVLRARRSGAPEPPTEAAPGAAGQAALGN